MDKEPVVVTKVTQNLDVLSKDSLLPGGIPASALPTPEFIEQVKRIEESEKEKPAVVGHPTTPQDHPKEVPAKRPIILEYKYSGSCETCGREVDTLLLNVETANIAVAWCTSCKKSLHQQKVRPIREEVKANGNPKSTDRPAVQKTVRQVPKSGKTSL